MLSLKPSFKSARSIMNTDRAQAWIFLVAETLYDYYVFNSLSKASVTKIDLILPKNPSTLPLKSIT